ncbi:DUF937 domain-containing protein [Kaistia dalseonensis]|uniref:DUF937 domain-containing protein n=1 Tax=Kaistia dalseonensis TaxID=410840 RepID=A0ABU0H8I9_9HYPH|nr:DUF937 domain-containing protein [Kaistia dalseonensis]MCX5495494.1 DUF937 domain-containing protein [Kaistia dalseonensis]MDQ0438085.1 hypothetical protein [Kaistia dalseonensis]
MKTFYDLMQEAQQNAMASVMAKEFGITAEQQAKAFEALMPAFWLGMRRSASDPFGVAAFWQSLGTGQYKSYFDNPFAAMTPSALKEGNGLLEKMFGSPEVAKAVALQVEAATGITQDIVRRMMPVMANMMVGGMQRQTESYENPFLRFMQDMTPGAAKPKKKQAPDLPFVTLMESFLGKQPEPEPDNEPMSNEEVIDRLFDAGRSMQDSYRKSMERIFDQFAESSKK